MATKKKTDRDMYTCISCGLNHKDVECSGIYYCPNVLCTVAGNEYFRYKLDSYEEVDSQHHTVDPVEWLYKGLKAAEEVKDSAIREAIKKSARKRFNKIIKDL